MEKRSYPCFIISPKPPASGPKELPKRREAHTKVLSDYAKMLCEMLLEQTLHLDASRIRLVKSHERMTEP